MKSIALNTFYFSVKNYGPRSFCPQENNFHHEKHLQEKTKRPTAFHTISAFHIHASAPLFTDMTRGKKAECNSNAINVIWQQLLIFNQHFCWQQQKQPQTEQNVIQIGRCLTSWISPFPNDCIFKFNSQFSLK